MLSKTYKFANDNKPSEELQYFVVGPDNKVYVNKQNLPIDALQKFKVFKDSDQKPFRFAFDPVTGQCFFQDDMWTELLQNGDANVWRLANGAIKYVSETFKIPPAAIKKQHGEPPVSKINKLSQYGIAWRYLLEYVHKEFNSEPIDIAVIEYPPENENDVDPGGFSPTGITKDNVTTNIPTIYINRGLETDYGTINHFLIIQYLHNFETITKYTPDSYKKRELMSKFVQHLNWSGYDVYFAVWSAQGTRLFKTNEAQRNRIVKEEDLRQMLGGYDGPLVIFSFLPVRNQVIFQNMHPESMKQYEVYSKMLEDIKKKMSQNVNIPEEKLVLSHDDSEASPFITTISKEGILWDYIKTMCNRAGIDAQDITVVEMPLSRTGEIVAMFVRSSTEEKQKLPEAEEAKLSHGISINYPYIAVESRIKNVGKRYYAIIHEYAHYMQALKKLPHIAYSFQGGIGDTRSEIERKQRFIEYINNPLEQDAHIEHFLFMLHMGMLPATILDSVAKRNDLLARSEYGKILEKAKKIYIDERKQLQKPQKQAKIASLGLGINDWWYIGLQEQMNESKHTQNQQTNPNLQHTYNKHLINPQNIGNQKKKSLSTEELLSVKHDKELSYMKPAEKLLRESRI